MSLDEGATLRGNTMCPVENQKVREVFYTIKNTSEAAIDYKLRYPGSPLSPPFLWPPL
jgi:hypothetical protein